ncbi:unnamed protein product [Urochloa humidicola]
MPNRSLDFYIENGLELDWQKNIKIIVGVANGLHYLQDQRIAHLDLKPSNILLDSDMNPRIGDFRIARMLMCLL